MFIDWKQIYATILLKNCKPFTKHCERIKKFRETGELNIYIETM